MNQLIARQSIFRFLLFACFWAPLRAHAQAYWQQRTDFDIAVTLDDTRHTLDGEAVITYHNHSPDTLRFIWFHLWPNAFKNDRTAFSEQLVEKLDNTAFYFSGAQEKGYINKLAFRVNDQGARLEEHPQYIDITKLLLPDPLAPGDSIRITTPFHVQLPKNFSRGGHIGQSYQITQWYPKPAVYDARGWHPMPYLDQGEFYNDFGNYTVRITLPQNYVVAATGRLLDEAEKQFLLDRREAPTQPQPARSGKPVKKDIFKKTADPEKANPPSATATKTLHYEAASVTDFAWFADKRFLVQYDTISQPGRPPVEAYTFVLPEKKALWKNSLDFTRRAVHFYASQLGAYPYPSVSVVCAPPATAIGGMEYPMVALVNVPGNPQNLDLTIAHEVGHNWFQALLSTDERVHPWMDEGMNSFYERKYGRRYYPPTAAGSKSGKGRVTSEDGGEMLLTYATDTKTDQPIETSSDAFTRNNYIASAYTKAALWMELLERNLGTDRMAQLMQTYFATWQQQHPQPADFKNLVARFAGQETDSLFRLLQQKGPLPQPMTDSSPPVSKIGLVFPTLNATTRYITIAPAIGVNVYDKAQVGLLVHNYGIPVPKFRFAVAPLYATGSKQFNYIGTASYTFYPQQKIHTLTPAVSVARFSTDDGTGVDGNRLFRGFSKIVPSVKLVFREKSPASTVTRWVQWKSYFITEGVFNYVQHRPPQDSFSYYAVKGPSVHRAVHELNFGIRNNRSLYPYEAVLQVQRVGDLLRTGVTGHYYFNYNQLQGVNIRFFAGKIFYTKAVSDKVRYENDRYFFNMYGNVNSLYGTQDYTYSSPFLDRNQTTALAGRQILIRDGGFKYRTDFASEIGRSDNWLAALNASFDIPASINPLQVLPFRVPLKVFADVGTYAGAWSADRSGNRFLYSIGLQLPVVQYIHIYLVLLQSSQFKEPTLVNGPKWWQQRLTFSVDLHAIHRQLPLDFLN